MSPGLGWRRAALAAGVALALLLSIVVAMAVVAARLGFRLGEVGATGLPDDGRWRLALPRLAGRPLDAPVNTVLRLATLPLSRRLLDGRHINTPFGQLRLTNDDEYLRLRCAPCRLDWPELAPQPLPLASAELKLARVDHSLRGVLSVGGVAVEFTGELADDRLTLHWNMPPVALARLLAPLAPSIPELARIELRGRVAASGTGSLPDGRWQATPRFEAVEVFGLGTEGLAHGRFTLRCRDVNGDPLRQSSGENSENWLAWGETGAWLARAVLAAEDAGFFEHQGFDLVEIVRAQAENATLPTRRGASTISQQLAKTLFTGGERTLARKLRELLYVIEMERTLGKRRILLLYLNTVDWGPGVCGAKAAALFYFAKTPDQLNLVQAAWLAGILRNPHQAHRDEFLAARAAQVRLRWVIKNLRLPAKERRAAVRPIGFAAPPAALAAPRTSAPARAE